MLVWNKPEALQRLMNNETLLNRVAVMFVKTTPEQLVQLQTSIMTCDYDTAQRLAHTLKGASANIGAELLADVCARLEKAASDSSTDFAPLLSELEQAHAILLEQLPR